MSNAGRGQRKRASSDTVREALAHAPDVTVDPARCRNLLTDLTFGDDTSARLLTIAVEIGLADELARTASPPGVRPQRYSQMLKSLTDQGIDDQSATYVLETWAESFGVKLLTANTDLDPSHDDGGAGTNHSNSKPPSQILLGSLLALTGTYACFSALLMATGNASLSIGTLAALLWTTAVAIFLLIGAALCARNRVVEQQFGWAAATAGLAAAILLCAPILYWRGDLDTILPAAAVRLDGWLYTTEWRAPRRQRVEAPQLQKGDCLDDLQPGGIAGTVSCALPHSYQVIDVQELNGPYRSPPLRACAELPGSTGLQALIAWPSPAQWQFDDTRWSVCVLAPDGAEIGVRPRFYMTGDTSVAGEASRLLSGPRRGHSS